MPEIDRFISTLPSLLVKSANHKPWQITDKLPATLNDVMAELDGSFTMKDGIAIHNTAVIEANVTVKAPTIIGKNCFIGANAYLRAGVFLDESVHIGPGCEIKQSIICMSTAVAHFNYIGNSIVGRNVNFEAGSVIANHYNERKDKKISVLFQSELIATGVEKFGALVGDNCRIGANAVLSPGTLLLPGTIVKRLELVEQLKP